MNDLTLNGPFDEVELVDDIEDGPIEVVQDLRVTDELRVRLSDMAIAVSQERLVSYPLAQGLRAATVGLESMDAHFARYPIASYTQLPSTTNLEVTQESLAKSIKDNLIRGAKALFRFFADLFTRLGNWWRSNKRAVEQADKVSSNVGELFKANQSIDSILQAHLSTKQVDALNLATENLEQQVAKTYGSQWNRLLTTIVTPDTDDDDAMNPVGVFVACSKQITVSANAFVERITEFTDMVAKATEYENSSDYLSSALPSLNMVDAVASPALVHAYAKTRVQPARVDPSVSPIQVDAQTILAWVKSYKANRTDFALPVPQMVWTVAKVRQVSEEGMNSFAESSVALLKVASQLNTASTTVTDAMSNGDLDDGAFSMLNEVLVYFRSWSAAIYDMESASKMIFQEIGFLTNVLAQYERGRAACQQQSYKDPEVSAEIHKEVEQALKELRRKLR